jgi:hypothetical protein
MDSGGCDVDVTWMTAVMMAVMVVGADGPWLKAEVVDQVLQPTDPSTSGAESDPQVQIWMAD